MQPNPTLRTLGFADNDRVVIIHADDIGMCEASVSAFADLLDAGLVSSGAVMMPCAWALHAASLCRQCPDADVGVHLTITSEWETYRWGPLSTRDPASGLIDEQGFFFHGSWEAQTRANPDAVAHEIAAQLDRAVAYGIDTTHADVHMGALGHPKLIPGYIQCALRYRLPPLLLRLDEADWRARGFDAEAAAAAADTVRRLEAEGMPTIDYMRGMDLSNAENRMEQAKQALAGLSPGLTHFIIHPSHDTPELRAITPDWASRVADYETFASAELRNYVRDQGIQVIGYRPLRELMRRAMA
jgi:hypothetical protein